LPPTADSLVPLFRIKSLGRNPVYVVDSSPPTSPTASGMSAPSSPTLPSSVSTAATELTPLPAPATGQSIRCLFFKKEKKNECYEKKHKKKEQPKELFTPTQSVVGLGSGISELSMSDFSAPKAAGSSILSSFLPTNPAPPPPTSSFSSSLSACPSPSSPSSSNMVELKSPSVLYWPVNHSHKRFYLIRANKELLYGFTLVSIVVHSPQNTYTHIHTQSTLSLSLSLSSFFLFSSLLLFASPPSLLSSSPLFSLFLTLISPLTASRK